MTRASEIDLSDLQRALAGRYELQRRVGSGGMGIVYLAHELRLDRRVAIKVLPPERAAQAAARERFLREARTAAQLFHPNIVPIFTVDESADIVFYAMSFVDGETLGHRVRRAGPLAPADAARVLRDVARALSHAHDQGVVHRDVKPDNILLDRATGRALVADFGIARVGAENGVSGPHEVLGTAEFMSPEQAAGGVVDARSDLYSLGVVGYYALSGRLPFAASDAVTLLALHLTQPAPPLARFAPDVPRRLVQVVHRCLEKEPQARFESGAELARALTLAVLDHGVPPLALRAFLTQCRRLPGLVVSYLAVVALGVVPLLLASFLEADAVASRVVAAGVALAAALLPFGLLVGRVRRLLDAGHDWHDLTETLGMELVRRREELAFTYGPGPGRLERMLRALAYTALAVAGAGLGLPSASLTLAHGSWLPAAFWVSLGTALVAAAMSRMRTEQRTDPQADRRLRFWRGAFGRVVFRLAAIGRARPAPRSSGPHSAELPVATVSAWLPETSKT